MYDDDEINWVDQVDGAEGGGERLAVGLALRDAYWKLLAQARQHYASSEPYQTIRSSVMKGFSNLGR